MAARQPLSPQAQVIVNALKAAQATANQRYRSNNAATVGLRQALGQRAQGLSTAYDQAASTGSDADAAASQAVAGLGSGADPYKAIMAGESASGIRRAATSRAQASDEIGQIGVSIGNRQAANASQIGQDLTASQQKIVDAALTQLGNQQTAQALENQRIGGQIKVANVRGQQESQRQQSSQSFQQQQQQRQQNFQAGQQNQRLGAKGGKPGALPGTSSQRSKAIQQLTPPAGQKAITLYTRQQRHNAISKLVLQGGFDPQVANWAVHTFWARQGRPTGPPKPGGAGIKVNVGGQSVPVPFP